MLVLLWLVGTAVATGVVFQAVNGMTNTFRRASEGASFAAGKPKPKPATPTTTLGSVVVRPTTVTPVTEATTTTTPPATVATVATDLLAPETTDVSGPEPAGSATSTGTRTTVGPLGSVPLPRPTPGPGVTNAPPVTPSPTPAPTPATEPTAPTTPPQTAPPTTPPAAAPQCVRTQTKKVVAGANYFFVSFCPDADGVSLVRALVHQVPGYAARVNDAGPPVVDVTFSGPSTYHCVVTIQDRVLDAGECSA